MLDQFYTRNDVAKECIQNLIDCKECDNFNDFDIILEPSVGTGSFYKNLDITDPENRKMGLDLEPKVDSSKYKGIIKKMNYFNFIPDNSKRYLVIGNPPFGRVSSTAVQFFNKSAEFADVIAFIIPRTFKRVSIQNKLNLNFHLVYNRDLPLKPCCFKPKMSAKCCFQIWIKRNVKRVVIKYKNTHPDFKFLKLGPKDSKNQPTPPQNADFVIKAYGSNCGNILIGNSILKDLRPKSWHWIKIKENSSVDIPTLIKRLKSLDYSVSRDTVRQDSIGQGELVHLYKCKFQ